MLEAESEMELSCSATVHPVASDLLSCPESVRMQEWERDSVLLYNIPPLSGELKLMYV